MNVDLTKEKKVVINNEHMFYGVLCNKTFTFIDTFPTCASLYLQEPTSRLINIYCYPMSAALLCHKSLSYTSVNT